MTTPPKKLSFAEEMELLKKQKVQQAEHAKVVATQKRQELAAAAKARAASELLDTGTNAGTSSVDIQARLDAALATVMLSAGKPVSKSLGISLSQEPRAAMANTTPVLLDDERQRKIQAMEAAFSQHVGERQLKNGKKEKNTGTMMFCTSCRSTTPGEHVKPGVGLARGLIGLLPGIAYFLYRQVGGEQQCTHCQAATLVAMTSVQARTLCGDQHATLMAAGWAEMRRAQRDYTRNRRIAMAQIMVVGVVLLGASLYFMRAPSTALGGMVGSGSIQQLRTQDQLRQQEEGDGQ